jgi:periplasmic protein TonB
MSMTPQPENSTSPSRQDFAWPPSQEDLDTIQVIVLDPLACDTDKAENRSTSVVPRPRQLNLVPVRVQAVMRAVWPHRPTRSDFGYGLLTMASVAGVALGLAMQVGHWQRTAASPGPSTAAAVAAKGTPPALLVGRAAPAQSVIVQAPSSADSARLAGFDRIEQPSTWKPRSETTATRRAPKRTIRPADSARAGRLLHAAVVSPPIRLPESYVQPRAVSSGRIGRVRGKVVLAVEVRPNGRVGDVDVLSDSANPDLEDAAISAVKRWRYRPALRDGIPTPARLKVIVNFS